MTLLFLNYPEKMMTDQAEELKSLMNDKNNNENNPFKHAPQRKTRIITVTSGKGGVGKTNIATNMGIAYAKMGKKVIVIDADLGLANVNVMMNIIPKYNLYHVIKKQKKLSEIAQTGYLFIRDNFNKVVVCSNLYKEFQKLD